MKRRLSFALGAGIFASAAFSAVPTNTYAENITGHWAYEEMSYLIDHKILGGDEKGNYLPNKAVTRAEFATFLVRALDLSSGSASVQFSDVKQGNWFYHTVNVAASHNLIAGVGNGKFNPNANITRQEMAVMIKRAMDYLHVQTTPTNHVFKDEQKIASWASFAVDSVVGANILVGRENNNFDPAANTTRAEAATVIYRILNPGTNTDKPVVGSKEYITQTYPSNFDSVSTKQAYSSPKVDGGGIFTASKSLVEYYMNPGNFSKNSVEYYQFLKLSSAVEGLNVNKINTNVLQNKGVLTGKAEAFIEAGKTYNINAIYLMSHAMHETGNGTSVLAKGVEVGLNAENKPEMVTASNRSKLTDIKKTYNVYGIGAVDKDPNKFGSETAYSAGWFTVEKAIVGGAAFVKEKYIGIGQDTLYKMRWNPENPATHQYATHVMWATIQAKKIQEIYALTNADETTQLIFEVPKYEAQPATSPMPNIENHYAVNPAFNGATGIVQVSGTNLNVRTFPVSGTVITSLSNLTEVLVLGENGGWYRISVNGKQGWVSGQYLTFKDALKVKNTISVLNIRANADATSQILGTARGNGYVIGIKDADGNFIKDPSGKWYNVLYNQQPGWVSAEYIQELNPAVK